jgi:hypothetical protein
LIIEEKFRAAPEIKQEDPKEKEQHFEKKSQSMRH